MNSKIILSADSTCDLGDELKSLYNIHYYPFHIILGDKQYQDNIDIHPEDIYRCYHEQKILPKTAAINYTEYVDYFKTFTEQGYEVIHLCLGGALSSSCQNCYLAASELEGVYPINSCNLSTGIGLLVLEAAKLIKQGLSAKEVQAKVQADTSKVHSSFVLNTLEFLHAGGRCSTIAALGANLLNLKPCIEVDNTSGAMTVGKKYRGNLDKVLVSYTKDKLNAYDQIDYTNIFITHSGIDEKYISLVKQTILAHGQFENIHITKASCTISSHCGPNTLGVVFMTQ